MTEKAAGKFLIAGFICYLGIGLLKGCSEKRIVEYEIEGNTGAAFQNDDLAALQGSLQGISEKNSESFKSLGQLAENTGYCFHKPKEDGYWLSEMEDGTQVTLSIEDVEVLIPDTEDMYVLNAIEPEFDADYKERLARHIFFAGDIYDYDIRHAPRNDLIKWRERWQREYNSCDEKDIRGRESLLDMIQSCDEALETAGDTYTLTRSYESDRYLGSRNGIRYELAFYSGVADGWNASCRTKEITLMPQNVYQVCPNEVSGVEGLYFDTVEFESQPENQCGLSEQEAKELAEEFIRDLGLSYPIYGGAEPLAWWKGTNYRAVNANYLADGYVFFYDFGIDEVSFVASGVQENYGNMRKKKEVEGPQYNMMARLKIYVTENGVIGMRAHNPLELSGMSKEIKILSLDTAKMIMKEQTAENGGQFRFDLPDNVYPHKIGEYGFSVLCNKMELIYFRIRDKEIDGSFSFIPAWRLSEQGGWGNAWNGVRIDNPVIINAIDGTVINFYEEA